MWRSTYRLSSCLITTRYWRLEEEKRHATHAHTSINSIPMMYSMGSLPGEWQSARLYQETVPGLLYFTYLNPRPRYYYFRFLKKNGLTFHCHWHVILHRHTKFYANWMITGGVMTSYRFYKMAAAIASQIYFRFLVWTHLTFKKV